MKKTVLFLLLILFTFMNAQQFPFSQKWEEVQVRLESGQLKSIESLINEIYAAAVKENSSADLIKALIIKSQIAVQTSDDKNAVIEIAENFKSQISIAEGAEKAVLQSLLAQLYFNYYRENQYRITTRTDLAAEGSKDFRTWDSSRFLAETDSLLQQSLNQKSLLSSQKTDNFELLLEGEDKWRFLRPSVYDMLAYRALNIYQDEFAFGRQEFNQETKKERIDQIYTSLIEIHRKDREPNALIEAELQQVKYKFKESNSSAAHRDALHSLNEKYGQKIWSANILYQIALTYTTGSEEENDYVKAIEICEQAISRFPGSLGADRCRFLKEKIELPELSFETDGTLYADQYNPLYITHKNTDLIYYRIYRQNLSQLHNNLNGFEFDYKNDKFITNGNPVKYGKIELKNFTDYKSHTVTYPFEPLPPGNYIIIIADNDNFTGIEKNQIFQSAIISTGIDLAQRNHAAKNATFNQGQLLHKNNGLPLANESVQVFKADRDQPFAYYKQLNSDEIGRFNLQNEERDYYHNFVLKTNREETYFPVRMHHYLRNSSSEKWQNRTVYFTDRGIYRPGQTVYFKGILYRTLSGKNEIQPEKNTTVLLKNVNGEIISQLNLVSNEFGSVHGEFVLPAGGLTGSFSITDNFSQTYHSIQVEEYKRPKFKAEIDSLQGAYQLNDEIKISGNAEMFSGAKVTDAKVVYRVYRQSYNPYRWLWRPIPQEPEVEITQGETSTGAEGQFSFNFEALPAKPKQPGQNRAYIYKIIADITDISGETQTAHSSVRIGDIPLQIVLDVHKQYGIDEFNSLKIKTTNLNGITAEASGRITITEILPADRILRPLQKETDYELIPKEEFIQKLPYIAYENEHLPENRKHGQVLIDQTWNTAENDSISWKVNLQPGTYEVRAYTVYKNDTVAGVQTVEILNSAESRIYFTADIQKESLQPGENAGIVFSSDTPDAHVTVELEANGEILKTEILDLKNPAAFRFPVTEDYRGGVYVHYYFHHFNQSIAQTAHFDVPYNNKKLDITTSVLRDKIEPGQEEIWELTIKSKKGDAFLAEVLAGMYDKSLDEFAVNSWQFFPYANNYVRFSPWQTKTVTHFNGYSNVVQKFQYPEISFEDLNLFGLTLNEFRRNFLARSSKAGVPPALVEEAASAADAVENNLTVQVADASSEGITGSADDKNMREKQDEITLDLVPVRKNLQETAFFFPELKTDKNGNIRIQFTVPESLTAWNFQTVAHTKDLKTGTFQSEIITQKELMVVPNAPRFLREGDQLEFMSRIINLSDTSQSGKAQLQLFDAFTMQPVDAEFGLTESSKEFSVLSGGNTTVQWILQVPPADEIPTLVYRVVATSGAFSDGEENALPVLTNRTLVTETMPLSVRENQTKTFTFDKLVNNNSESSENFKLTMELTANPLWYAVMALPYLREFPYECSEQIFARLYGNLISQQIVNSNPKIKTVFDDWNRKGELISPLEKNEELKNILLEETPWLRDAQNESEQMKRIAVLFDLNTMRNELQQNIQKLRQKQSPGGGFPWFDGGKDNVYVTTHIVAGFGHLKKMDIGIEGRMDEIPHKAINFIDNEMKKAWDKFQSDKKRFPLSGYDGIYWLYARSYYLDTHPLENKLTLVRDYFLTELEKEKFGVGLQTQGMLALVFNRYGYEEKAKSLVFGIKDRSTVSDEMGMYWKENVSGYSWWEAPVETQALLIEAFDEIDPEDVESIESMKVWLIKNKQTHQWTSTKATTEAVYALMNTGKDWVDAEKGVNLKIGNNIWYSAEVKPKSEIQSGSGYVKESWDKMEITPEMGIVEISKTSPGVAWGAMYWQYFEDLDKISHAQTNVKFRKQMFIQRNTNQGPKLFEISPESQIQLGDLVKVRLEIQTDRAMEFVHIKDMRASGFEPVNVISRFKWQDGLGYYESTRDAATNFFIDYLPKGVYVFEYDLRANNAGDFSNGITQLQNMYAPEFMAHSEGVRVKIE